MKKVGFHTSIRQSLRNSVAFARRLPARDRARKKSRFISQSGEALWSDEEKFFRGVNMEALIRYVDRLLDGDEAPDVDLYTFSNDFRVRGELAIFISKGTTVMYRGTVGLTTRISVYLPGVGDISIDADLVKIKPRKDWTTSDLLEFVMKGHPDDGNCVGAMRTHRLGASSLFKSEDLGDPYEGSVVSHRYTTNLSDMIKALAEQFRQRGRDLQYACVWLNLFADVGVEGRLEQLGDIPVNDRHKPRRTLRERIAAANARGAAIAAAATKVVGAATTEAASDEGVDSDDEEEYSVAGDKSLRRSLRRNSSKRLSRRKTEAMHNSVHQALAATKSDADSSNSVLEPRRRPQLLDKDILDGIQRFNECLLYMASWEEQIESLHDIEFVCELYTLSNLKGRRSNLDIVMPRDQYERYIMYLADDYDGLMLQIFGADQSRARAAVSVAHAEQLHLEIEKLDEGFETLEASILLWMQDWLLRDLLRSIDRERYKASSLASDRRRLVDLLTVGARMMNEFGTLDRAHDFLEEALEITNDPTLDTSSRHSTKSSLGTTRKEASPSETAERAEHDAAEQAFKNRNPDQQRARIQHDLALVRLDLGRYQEALDGAEQAVALRRELFGKRTLPVAQSLLVFGKILGAFDRHGDMYAASVQALDIVRAHEEKGNEKGVEILTAEGLFNLATVHIAQNQLQLALDELQQVQNMQLEVLGYLHPAIIDTLLTRANALLLLKLPGRALQRCRDAARIARQRQMSQHPYMARVHACMGRTSIMQGHMVPALDRFEKALQIMQVTLNESHPEILDIKFWIAEMMAEGRPVDSIEAHKHIMDLRVERIGKKSLAVAQSLHAIGKLQCAIGELDNARENIVMALRIRRKWHSAKLPPPETPAQVKAIHPLVAESALQLALIDDTLNKVEEAVPLYEEYLQFAQDENLYHPEATTSIALAKLWMRTGQHTDDIMPLLDQAHYVARKALQSTMEQIAATTKSKDRLEGFTMEVLQSYKIQQGDLCADALAAMSELHQSAGRYPEALSSAEEAVVIRSKLHGTKSLPVAELVRKTADILLAMGKQNEALTRLEKIYSIQKASSAYKFNADVLFDISKIYIAQNKPNKAIKRLSDALAVAEVNGLPQAMILMMLGLQTRQNDKALEYLQACLKQFETEKEQEGAPNPEPADLALAKLRTGSILLDRDESANLQEALPLLIDAQTYYAQAYEASPADSVQAFFEASARLGQAYFALERYGDVVSTLEQPITAVEDKPEGASNTLLFRSAVVRFSQALFLEGAYEAALPWLEKAASLQLKDAKLEEAESSYDLLTTSSVARNTFKGYVTSLKNLRDVYSYLESEEYMEIMAMTQLRIACCLMNPQVQDPEGALEAFQACIDAFELMEHSEVKSSHSDDLAYALFHVIELLQSQQRPNDEVHEYQVMLFNHCIDHPDLMDSVKDPEIQLLYVQYLLHDKPQDSVDSFHLAQAAALCNAALAEFSKDKKKRLQVAKLRVCSSEIILRSVRKAGDGTTLQLRTHLEVALGIILDLEKDNKGADDAETAELVSSKLWVLRLLVQVAREDGYWTRVLDLLGEISKIEELGTEELILQGRAYVEMGLPEEAADFLEPILRSVRKEGNDEAAVNEMLRLIKLCLEQRNRVESDFDRYLYDEPPVQPGDVDEEFNEEEELHEHEEDVDDNEFDDLSITRSSQASHRSHLSNADNNELADVHSSEDDGLGDLSQTMSSEEAVRSEKKDRRSSRKSLRKSRSRSAAPVEEEVPQFDYEASGLFPAAPRESQRRRSSLMERLSLRSRASRKSLSNEDICEGAAEAGEEAPEDPQVLSSVNSSGKEEGSGIPEKVRLSVGSDSRASLRASRGRRPSQKRRADGDFQSNDPITS